MLITRSPRPYGWRRYREARRRFLVRNVWVVVALSLLATATLTLQTLWAHGYLLGLIHGAFLVALAAMLRFQFWAHTGAFNLLVGAHGEDDTRAELRRAARSERIFGWIDSIELEHSDIDHLVATPAGWYAIDTKWRSKPLSQADSNRDASSAYRAASKARSVLRSLGAVAPVRPVVVVWGGATSVLPEEGYCHTSGVHFVPGRHLLGWLAAQPQHAALTMGEANHLLAQLDTFRTKHLRRL